MDRDSCVGVAPDGAAVAARYNTAMSPLLRPGSRSSSDDPSPLWRLSGMGFELASYIVAGLLLGWGLDALFKTYPTILIIGVIAGTIVGMVEFIRSAIRAQQRASRTDQSPTLDSGSEGPGKPPTDSTAEDDRTNEQRDG
jgi:F0F1-type ATP synthase assembly protein I